MVQEIRVRFAPSPTGFLHIGGVRTALFNYLFAKKEKGTFLLRIEDTDQERSHPEFEDEILESLKWLNLNWDEPFFRQSSRLNGYQDAVQELIEQGKAYRIEENGRAAVKLKVPKGMIRFHDLVHGPIEFDSQSIEDFVLQKSDGYPTYHLACAVDDHEMNISHVIRGDDHLSNTPKQILIHQAFGWNPPAFAHLPLVFGQDKTPLSKRHGAVALSAYRKEGYLPEALLNYLALLGWSPGTNQEIFTREELINQFSLERIHKTNACFDSEKLKWLNAEHIRRMNQETYLKEISKFLAADRRLNHPRFKQIALLYRDRIRTFQEFLEQTFCFFQEEVKLDRTAVEKHLKHSATRLHLEEFKQKLSAVDFGSPAKIEVALRETAKQLGIPAGHLIHPTRVAMTGKAVSPGLFEVMSLLDKEVVLRRLEYVIIRFGELTQLTSK